MSTIKQFIESLENKNTIKVIKHVLKNAPEDIDRFQLEEINQFVLNQKPKSEKQITTIRYVLGLYAKWLMDNNLVDGTGFYENVQAINKKTLWKEAKPVAEDKFISYSQYLNILREISIYEEYNPLYYEALFSCIYEGLYSDDLSILKNLRKSDIEETVVTLHEDNGKTYKMYISKELSGKMKELSTVDTWKRPNRYGICNVDMTGICPDSVFKVEKRRTQSDGSWKFTYYSKLRKIKDEYIGFDILPYQIYVSGLVHRIKVMLEKKGISLEEAFADNCRNQVAYQIISKELLRCNSIIEVGNFREMVKGHIDVFTDETVEKVVEVI